MLAMPQVAPRHPIKSGTFSMPGSLDRAATERQSSNKEPQIAVKIKSFEPLSEDEFTALRQQKARKTDPAMVALLAEVEAGRPVRVPRVEGQSARDMRTAISRAATSRGLTVETVEGDGFDAVRKTDEPRTRKGKQASSSEGQRRRGRPPKRQE
jgi:hypothetical protein